MLRKPCLTEFELSEAIVMFEVTPHLGRTACTELSWVWMGLIRQDQQWNPIRLNSEITEEGELLAVSKSGRLWSHVYSGEPNSPSLNYHRMFLLLLKFDLSLYVWIRKYECVVANIYKKTKSNKIQENNYPSITIEGFTFNGASLPQSLIAILLM